MSVSWGYSPKIEKYIPLGDFPADRYLIIAAQAIENLGWKLSHISEQGIIAYTSLSWQSYSEEISIRIVHNFAIFKSECVGIQLLFNDYGKNTLNLERFFHEFDYVEFHLRGTWEERLADFYQLVAQQDPDYFEKAPLTAKNKIRNVLYLLYPQKKYQVTPVLILVNVFCFVASLFFILLYVKYQRAFGRPMWGWTNPAYYLGANSRDLVLDGQYWRLLTHPFLHGSLSHLFFNMYALAYIGLMTEHKLGSKRFLVIYLLSGICGGLISLIYHPTGYMAGASGAIMGLFGAFLALLLSKAYEKNATRALLISTVLVVTIMLLNGAFKQRVDNAAHLGGLISGFIMGYALYKEKLWAWRPAMVWRYVALLLFTVVLAFTVLRHTHKIQTKEFLALEAKYRENWRTYARIYRIPASYTKEERLNVMEKQGIAIWKANDTLVKEMLALHLTKEHRAKAEYLSKMVLLKQRLVQLLYKESAENTRAYRQEIVYLTQQINTLKVGE